MTVGWESKRLEELCDVTLGKTPHHKNLNYWDKEKKTNNVWLSISDMLHGEIIEDSEEYVSELGASLFSPVPEGTILLSFKLTLGRVSFAGIPLRTNEAIASLLNLSPAITERFLYYYFSHFDWDGYASGDIKVKGKTLNKSKLKRIEVPIPSLSEQEAIVTILDETFAKIDQAKANIERNIENAKELFQSKLNELFTKNHGYKLEKLGSVCQVLNGYAFKSADAIDKSNTQLLRMGNLYRNVLDLGRKPVFYPDAFVKEFKDYVLKKGDLIMSLTGTADKTDYGYTVSIPDVDVGLLLNQRIMKIDVMKEDQILKPLLKYYLLSPDFLKKLYATASGTRQANLSSRTIMTLPITYPESLKEQEKLVKILDKIRLNTRKLVSLYTAKIIELEALKQSILASAFSGELTK